MVGQSVTGFETLTSRVKPIVTCSGPLALRTQLRIIERIALLGDPVMA